MTPAKLYLSVFLAGTCIGSAPAAEYTRDGPEVLIQDAAASKWYPKPKGERLEIFIEDEILPGSADKLAAGLAREDARQPLVTVHLASPGGRLVEAIKMAAALEHMREQGRTVRTYVTEYSECMSACMIVFMAGNERQVDNTSRLGFHQARAPSNTSGTPSNGEVVLNRMLSELLLSRGVSKAVADAWRDTPPDKMFIVEGIDAIENGIATGEVYTE